MDTSLTTTTTTTSAFTIQEYFAKRMAQLKSKPQVSAPDSDLSETPVEWKKGKKKTKEAAGIDVENSPQHKAKRHKKKKRVEAERGSVAKKRDQAELQPGAPVRTSVQMPPSKLQKIVYKHQTARIMSQSPRRGKQRKSCKGQKE